MESLTFYVGIIGNLVSVLMFLAPVATFWRIIRNRSTEEFESLPYICTLLNSSLWVYYGTIKPGAYLVATINGFGILVETIYIILFLVYAPSKMKAKTAYLVGGVDVGFLGAAVLVTQLAMQGDARIDAVGFLAAALNIVMYGSPLTAMKTVVVTRSVEYMPFLLSFFMFLNGAIWTFYSVLMDDIFVGVPNGTGFVLGTAQLVLYAIYRNAKPSSNVPDILDEEEGWQHQTLISPNDRISSSSSLIEK